MRKEKKRKKEKKKRLPLILRFLIFTVILVLVLVGAYMTFGARMLAKAAVHYSEKGPDFLEPVLEPVGDVKEGIGDMAASMEKVGIPPEEIREMAEDISYSDIVYYINEFKEKAPGIEGSVEVLFSRTDADPEVKKKFLIQMKKHVRSSDIRNTFLEMEKIKGPRLMALLPLFRETLIESLKEYEEEK